MRSSSSSSMAWPRTRSGSMAATHRRIRIATPRRRDAVRGELHHGPSEGRHESRRGMGFMTHFGGIGATALWLMLLLGAWHGINPGMGWLFAVALGMQEQRARAVARALVPIALGHALAIGAVVG